MTLFTLYQYTNQMNGKSYIGITYRPDSRQKEHAKGVRGALAFNTAVRKYGIGRFDYKVLAVFDDLDAAAYHERAAILGLGTLAPSGYNLRAGMPFSSYNGPLSAVSREKIRMAQRGRKHSAEHRAKNSKASMGNQHLLGYIPSAETRAKISTALKGRKFSDETIAKMSAAQKGRVVSPEAREKLRTANLGKRLSPETRAKMSAAHKRRRE